MSARWGGSYGYPHRCIACNRMLVFRGQFCKQTICQEVGPGLLRRRGTPADRRSAASPPPTAGREPGGGASYRMAAPPPTTANH